MTHLCLQAFCPLFRLHGHRGGPHDATTECGGTNGPNEVWNLAKDPEHYNAIVNMMRLREELRECENHLVYARIPGLSSISNTFLTRF